MKQLAKLFAVVLIVFVNAVPILAHGVRITHILNETTGEITVTAAFDTGEVLDNAAVVIFAPNDLINPWSTGTMDENGTYTFLPDYTIAGFWDIQVRKAGHGGLINVEITEDMAPTYETNNTEAAYGESATITLSDGSEVVIVGDVAFVVDGDSVVFETGKSPIESNTNVVQAATGVQPGGFTTAQIAIMSLSVIWGFVGTALYFAGRRKPKLDTR